MLSNMEKSYFLFVLITCFGPSWSSIQGNLTMPEVPLDFLALNDDDSESELSSQLQEMDERSSGWSPWSEWSACSRSCDGGASHQLRSCRTGPCRGEYVRYKICNMQSLATVLAFLAVANAGVLVGPSAKIIQGPSSRSTVIGPDGSAISAVAPAGQIIHEESVGVVAETAPIVAAPAVAYSAPVLAHAAPAVSYSAPLVSAHSVLTPAAQVVSAYSAPLVSASPVVSAYSAPLVSAGLVAPHSVDTVVAGPSGTIVSGRSVAAPAVVSAW